MSTNASNSSITAHPSQTKSDAALESNLMLSTDSPSAEIAEGEPVSLSTTSSSTLTTLTSSSSIRNDVNDDNRLQASTLTTNNSPQTPRLNRKRPAVNPKSDKGASDSNVVINLCDDDDDNKEEENPSITINIDDNTEFPSLSPPSPPPTERPQKKTDNKKTPTKLDSMFRTRSDLRPSKAVILHEKDEKSNTGPLKQSKLSFNKNGNVSLNINSRASSMLRNSTNDRSRNRTTRSKSNPNNNNKAGNNNKNKSNNEGNTKTNSSSIDNSNSSSKPKSNSTSSRCCDCSAKSLCKEDCSCQQVGLLCTTCDCDEGECKNSFNTKDILPSLPWPSSMNKNTDSNSSTTATSKNSVSNNSNNNNDNNDDSNKINLKKPPPPVAASSKISNPYRNNAKSKKKNNLGRSKSKTKTNPNSSPSPDSDDDDDGSSNVKINRRLQFGTGDNNTTSDSSPNTATTTATATATATTTTATTTTTTSNNTILRNNNNNIRSNNNNNNSNNSDNNNSINNINGNDNDNDGTNNRPPSRGSIPDAPSDISGADISAANKKLDTVYGDHIHDNSGSHLHGGIGRAEDLIWQGYHRRLLSHNQSLYDTPRGKLGKEITNEFSNLLDDVMKRKCNMEKFLVFPMVVLQRRHGVSKRADVQRRLRNRLLAWKEGKYKFLVEDTHQDLSAKQSKARGDTTPAHRAKVYSSKLLRGHLQSAVNYITDREGGGILYPDDLDEKSGHQVSRVLKDKHPPMRNPGPTAMPEYDSIPELPDLDITAETIEIVAGKLSGSAGLSGFDSVALKNLLLHHGQASQRLRNVCASFARWLANELPPWAAYRAMLANRLVALDKMPGIRPIGIGDIWRRFFAKCVLSVANSYATDSCGCDQLCAGLRAGVDGAIHGMSALWRELEAEDNTGFLLIDASNAFNEVSRVNMLWVIRHEWPAGARFAFNCYRHHSLLVVRNPGSKAFTFYSKEGVTQGDPLAMVAYGVAILPLIRKLKELNQLLTQSWYADDASAAGTFDRILKLFNDLVRIGPDFGYFPNASKSILITHPDRLEAAHKFFNETHRLGFIISKGHRFLGGFIGDATSRDEFVSSKVADWIHGTKELAEVARLKYPHVAYTGISKCLQHKWTFTQRVIPGVGNLFTPLEEEISNNFLPALFGEPSSSLDDNLRLLTALPVKSAGLALPNPVSSCAANYKNSTLMSSHLLLAVQGKTQFSPQDHRDTCLSSLSSIRELRIAEHKSSLTKILSALPPTADGLPCATRAINRACETGLWLSMIPNHINGNILGCDEFVDAIRLRYQKVPNNLPDNCDGCGSTFSVGHAHQCKNGGLIIRRHDELNRELASLASMALKESAIRAEPEINPSASITNSTKTKDATDTSGDRGDLLIRGFWENGMDAIIDVRITDTDAKSYASRDPKKILLSQEKEKKKKYLDRCLLQRRSFTPFVVSVDGLIGTEASNLLKQLSKRLSEKWRKPYSVTCGIVRSRISIACVRASHQCLRGSRIPFRTMSRQIQWDDGAGTGLYRIVH